MLAICDYGIGGLGLYKKLRQVTDADVLYFSDTGYTPYGKVPEQELRDRLTSVVDFLFNQGATHIAVACNSASSVLTEREGVSTIIRHGIEAVLNKAPKVIAIAGGRRTVVSQVYRDAVEDHGIVVKQQVAQELSIRIEAGDLDSEQLKAAISRVFEPLRACREVLLACTHYPVISKQILDQYPHFELIDPIDGMTKEVLACVDGLRGTSRVRWMTTGNVDKMRLAAQNAFGITMNEIEQLSL